jgi:hypothetical protein
MLTRKDVEKLGRGVKEYCEACLNREVRDHTRKQNLFNQSFHSHNYEHWPQMNENLLMRVEIDEEMKEFDVGGMIIRNNQRIINNGMM